MVQLIHGCSQLIIFLIRNFVIIKSAFIPKINQLHPQTSKLEMGYSIFACKFNTQSAVLKDEGYPFT